MPRIVHYIAPVAIAAVTAMALVVTVEPAQAQDSRRTGGVLEEIVVTAQKREQSLQDVGVAVTAFSGE
ncbi:MAG: hypothetical protein ACREQ1_11165, partial [Woeseiaceae bacterium]